MENHYFSSFSSALWLIANYHGIGCLKLTRTNTSERVPQVWHTVLCITYFNGVLDKMLKFISTN